MGFWDDTSPSSASGAAALSPLSADRIAAFMDAEGYTYNRDEDGDLITGFDQHFFLLATTGENDEVLLIRGRWKVNAPVAARGQLLEVLNEWSTRTLWPKPYLTVNDDGQVSVHTEMNVDLEHGVTDAQLSQLIRCGVATSLQLFEKLEEIFPDTRFDNAGLPPHLELP